MTRSHGLYGVVRHQPVDERLSAQAPAAIDPPASFDATFGLTQYGMQENDRLSNCFWAWVAHAQMVQALTGLNDRQQPVYVDGFIPPGPDAAGGWYDTYLLSIGQPTTPPGNGTDIYGGAASILSQGLAAYVGVLGGPFTPALLRQAIVDFDGGVGFCLALDPDAQKEFDDHVPWGTDSTTPDAEEGHCVDGCAYSAEGIVFITWGELEMSTDQFDLNCIDGLVFIITQGFITKNGQSAADALATNWGLTPAPMVGSAPEGFLARIEHYIERTFERLSA